jgi:5-formyltetrahydrofolate cyclo-ligase
MGKSARANLKSVRAARKPNVIPLPCKKRFTEKTSGKTRGIFERTDRRNQPRDFRKNKTDGNLPKRKNRDDVRHIRHGLNTVDFLQYCIAEGKQVVTPICQADHTMILAKTETYPEGFVKTKWASWKFRRKMRCGGPKRTGRNHHTRACVYDEGHRLGYGGGYYDRLFKIMPQKTVTICPAFDEFILPYIPTGITTRKSMLWFREKRTVFVRRNVK